MREVLFTLAFDVLLSYPEMVSEFVCFICRKLPVRCRVNLNGNS